MDDMASEWDRRRSGRSGNATNHAPLEVEERLDGRHHLLACRGALEEHHRVDDGVLRVHLRVRGHRPCCALVLILIP